MRRKPLGYIVLAIVDRDAGLTVPQELIRDHTTPMTGILICGDLASNRVTMFESRLEACQAIKRSHLHSALWYPNSAKEDYHIMPIMKETRKC
jgi:hypothetical protein